MRTQSTIRWLKALSVVSRIFGLCFKTGFDAAEMVCIRENLFEDGEWAILEWRVLKSVASTAINCSYFNELVNKSLSQSTTYQHHVSTRRQNSSTGARRPCRQVP
jgi:hypothetical protein